MAKNGAEYVKYVTERVVHYMETPKEERHRRRAEAKAHKEPWLTQWFGVAPLGLMIWWNGRKGRQRK
ncbi:YqzE family protein [Paenibacillus abyssi]|uniref:YqzE family protein n=1 Tax=Paenibacillus abyssi TaxID=1340531 RepID=A0A917G416_9BACL|nr:YqzE family protein [Paenibacillus abyssi]GGG22077.1 hypothetical protein GCM10010916_43410 [Paenibacillus abyssi]